jgi:hypothetical protein
VPVVKLLSLLFAVPSKLRPPPPCFKPPQVLWSFCTLSSVSCFPRVLLLRPGNGCSTFLQNVYTFMQALPGDVLAWSYTRMSVSLSLKDCVWVFCFGKSRLRQRPSAVLRSLLQTTPRAFVCISKYENSLSSPCILTEKSLKFNGWSSWVRVEF